MPTTQIEPQNATSNNSNHSLNWEARFADALIRLIEKGKIYETCSAAAGGLIYSGEFELPGSIPVAFEARPDPRSWGCVEVLLAIDPKLGGYPVQPSLKAPRDQGEGMAIVFVPYKQWPSPVVALLYVSRKLRRDLKSQFEGGLLTV